mgnify:CR=1 FL=1|jgi:hypothetical protein
MPTEPRDCANREINLQMCPCKNEGCANRGICCECIQAHYARNSTTSCMRGAQRDPATLNLMHLAVKQCSTNQARNAEFCVCTYEACERRGLCCSCVRNHFTVDGTGRTACMNGF